MEEEFIPIAGGQSSGSGASKTMRAGRKTYFFDAKESKNGNRYLQITESRQDQAGQRNRSSIFLFPDHIEQFQQTLSEVAAHL
jgi:hypothetical protein